MGSCGCADAPDFVAKIRAGVESWYGIEIFAGCHNCDSPAGVALWLLDERDDIERIPDKTPTGDSPSVGFPLFSRHALRDALLSRLDPEELADEIFSSGDIVEETQRELRREQRKVT